MWVLERGGKDNIMVFMTGKCSEEFGYWVFILPSVATHQLSHCHNTIKCWVMSLVNGALDEKRANHDCQEVYGSGGMRTLLCFHGDMSEKGGKNGYISWK